MRKSTDKKNRDQEEAKVAPHVLCEPVRSKCTRTCRKKMQEAFYAAIYRTNATPQGRGR